MSNDQPVLAVKDEGKDDSEEIAAAMQNFELGELQQKNENNKRE